MILSVQNVSVSFGARRVVSDVSVQIGAGEIVALLGPNGAGKTSLMRAALGLTPLSGGVVQLGGEDPRKLTPRARALKAAYLPQRPQTIWPISVEQVVALGRFAYGAAPTRLSSRDQQAVDAALDACGLSALRTRGMDQVSGGEKARAHLARALAQQAPLLMLDEPSAGLDPAQMLAMADVLKAHASAGGAVLMSTHDIALAARATHRMLLLREGQVVAEGGLGALTPEALRAAYGRSGRIVHVGETPIAVFD